MRLFSWPNTNILMKKKKKMHPSVNAKTSEITKLEKSLMKQTLSWLEKARPESLKKFKVV